jgi:formylglycine-generating enzyme required for sulfatase activity
MDYGFWLARYPVTVAQLAASVDESGARPGDPDALRDDPNRPVRSVSWHEALAFCDWLDRRRRDKGLLPAGCRVTLPSEPEWEKAARGGLAIPARPLIACLGQDAAELREVDNPLPQRRYPWGDAPNPELDNDWDSQVGTTLWTLTLRSSLRASALPPRADVA